MLNCFKNAGKLGHWYSEEEDWKIATRFKTKYSWAIFYKNKIIKRGSGVNTLQKAIDIAYESSQKLKNN